MAFTNIYVDPSIAANSGTGTSGDPYGDLQYALDSATHDTTNGTQINIKAGTAEVLSAVLNFTTYLATAGISTFTATAPLFFRGYTSTADDSGMGEVDCNGGSFISSTVLDNVNIVDLEIHNGGTADLIELDSTCSVRRCILHNTGGSVLDLDGQDIVVECLIYDYAQSIAGYAIESRSGSYILHNWVEATANGASGIVTETGSIVSGNVVWLRGASPTGYGIYANQDTVITKNTVVATNGSTASGIGPRYSTGDGALAENNVISGFAKGIEATGVIWASVQGNIYHNCTTAEAITGTIILHENNTTTSSTIFEDASTGDFRLLSGFRGTAHPQAYLNGVPVTNNDAGPIQHADPVGGGGGVARLIGAGGGLIG